MTPIGNRVLLLDKAYTAMQKDFKIGMLIGLAVVIVAAVVLSFQPAVSVSSRLRNLQRKQMQAQAASAPIFEDNRADNYKPAVEESKEQNIETIQQQKQSAEKKMSEQLQLSKINETKYHTVLSGQTLSDIAKEYYGSPGKWTKIRDANPKIDPYKLKPGMTLIITP